jgi:hypothetical protein
MLHACPISAGSSRVGQAVSPAAMAGLMEIPLLRGRTCTEQDGPNAPAAIVVSRPTARRFWGDAGPLGRAVRIQA